MRGWKRHTSASDSTSTSRTNHSNLGPRKHPASSMMTSFHDDDADEDDADDVHDVGDFGFGFGWESAGAGCLNDAGENDDVDGVDNVADLGRLSVRGCPTCPRPSNASAAPFPSACMTV